MEPSIYCGLILTLMIPRGRDSETGGQRKRREVPASRARARARARSSDSYFFLFTFTSFTIHQFIMTSLRRPKLRTASSRPDGSSNQDRTTSRVSLRAAPLPGIRMYVRKENQHFLWCGRQAGDTTVISTRTAACVECVSRCENGAATAGVSE